MSDESTKEILKNIENIYNKRVNLTESFAKLTIFISKLLKEKNYKIVPKHIYYLSYAEGQYGFEKSIDEYWEEKKNDEKFKSELLAKFQNLFGK